MQCSRCCIGKIVNVGKSNLSLRCDIPFKTKFVKVYGDVSSDLKIGDYVEITYQYDNEHLMNLETIKKTEIEICSRCFSFMKKGQKDCFCKSIRDIDINLRVHESMRLVHRKLCSGYVLGFVDKSGYYLRSERIFRINPLFDTIGDLVLNKSYDVIGWQSYKSTWTIDVIDIVDRGYIF